MADRHERWEREADEWRRDREAWRERERGRRDLEYPGGFNSEHRGYAHVHEPQESFGSQVSHSSHGYGGQTSRPDMQGGHRPQAGYVGSSRVDLQACKLEYSIVSPK